MLKEGELDNILRFGTAELFADGDEANNTITYDDEAINTLLDRDRHEDQPDNSQEQDDYLRSFKVCLYCVCAHQSQVLNVPLGSKLWNNTRCLKRCPRD